MQQGGRPAVADGGVPRLRLSFGEGDVRGEAFLLAVSGKKGCQPDRNPSAVRKL